MSVASSDPKNIPRTSKVEKTCIESTNRLAKWFRSPWWEFIQKDYLSCQTKILIQFSLNKKKILTAASSKLTDS